jgi:zinc protease
MAPVSLRPADRFGEIAGMGEDKPYSYQVMLAAERRPPGKSLVIAGLSLAPRAWVGGLLGLWLAVSTGAAGAAPPAYAPAPLNDWPQAHSDIRADPAIRFAVLPNGMRYAIMKNATPKGEVAIRFRIGAGSLQETDAQQGLAHFLEHMAFRGSTHVPESEVWTGLQRLGMAIGADTSAYTTETQTFYQLNLPNAEAGTVDFGLMRMREIASELTLSQIAMDSERGTVLGEERLRDTPDFRTTKAQRSFFLKDQWAIQRYPIGKVEVIQHAPVSLIRDFYQAYYRPERATLIVVGDIDPDEIEAKIKARFSDWSGAGPAGLDPRLDPPAKRAVETRLVVDSNMARSTMIGWVSPYEAPPATRAVVREDLLQSLGMTIVNRRLQVLANSPERPFQDAMLSRQNLVRSARVTFLGISNDPQNWRAALEAAETARRQAVQFGVTQAEVDREATGLREHYKAAAASASTRPTAGLANALLSSAESADVFSSPAQNLALVESILKGLTADQVSVALREAFKGSGPLVFVAHPIPLEGGEAEVARAFAQIEAKPIVDRASDAKLVWPYTAFGPAGKVVERRTISDLDTTLVGFSNGVRLTVKPTKFSADQVLVSVKVGGGILDLPRDRKSARWAADGGGFVLGGLKAIGFEDLQSALNAKAYNVSFATRDDGFYLTGATRPADLDTQMQVLAAYLTDPGWRPEAFERIRANAGPSINALVASPTGVMQLELPVLLHNGDPRWASPNFVDLSQAKPEDLKATLERSLGAGPIEVTVVGDISVERAIRSVASTFGALPQRTPPTPPQPSAREVHFPPANPKPLVLHHRGRPDQALALIAWPTIDNLVDPQKVRDIRVLEQIIQLRLFDQLRVVDGAAYEAQTGLESSEAFPGYGDVYAFAEVPPDKTDLFFQVIAKITADLRAHEVSADELERGRRPRVELFTQNQQNNGYWLGSLSNAQSEPAKLDLIRSTIPDLKQVNAAGVHRAAMDYFTDDKAFKLVVLPAPKVVAAAAAGPQPATVSSGAQP